MSAPELICRAQPAWPDCHHIYAGYVVTGGCQISTGSSSEVVSSFQYLDIGPLQASGLKVTFMSYIDLNEDKDLVPATIEEPAGLDEDWPIFYICITQGSYHLPILIGRSTSRASVAVQVGPRSTRVQQQTTRAWHALLCVFTARTVRVHRQHRSQMPQLQKGAGILSGSQFRPTDTHNCAPDPPLADAATPGKWLVGYTSESLRVFCAVGW